MMGMTFPEIIALVKRHSGPDLDLEESGFFSKHMEELAQALNENSNITDLCVSRNNLMTEGAVTLVRSLKHVKRINFSQCDIGDDFPLDFVLKEKTGLEWMELSDNRCITDKSRDKFLQATTDLNLIGTSLSSEVREEIHTRLDILYPASDYYDYDEEVGSDSEEVEVYDYSFLITQFSSVISTPASSAPKPAFSRNFDTPPEYVYQCCPWIPKPTSPEITCPGNCPE